MAKGRLKQFLATSSQFQGLQAKFYGVPESTYETSIEMLSEAHDVQKYFGITSGSDRQQRTAAAMRQYFENHGIRVKPPKTTG